MQSARNPAPTRSVGAVGDAERENDKIGGWPHKDAQRGKTPLRHHRTKPPAFPDPHRSRLAPRIHPPPGRADPPRQMVLVAKPWACNSTATWLWKTTCISSPKPSGWTTASVVSSPTPPARSSITWSSDTPTICSAACNSPNGCTRPIGNASLVGRYSRGTHLQRGDAAAEAGIYTCQSGATWLCGVGGVLALFQRGKLCGAGRFDRG